MKNVTCWDVDFLKDQLALRTRHPITINMATDLAAFITGTLFNTRSSKSLRQIMARIGGYYGADDTDTAEALWDSVARASWCLPMDPREFLELASAKGFPRNVKAIRQLCLTLIGTVHNLIETYAAEINKCDLGKEPRALKNHKSKKLSRH